jgi:hypothetical protein
LQQVNIAKTIHEARLLEDSPLIQMTGLPKDINFMGQFTNPQVLGNFNLNTAVQGIQMQSTAPVRGL